MCARTGQSGLLLGITRDATGRPALGGGRRGGHWRCPGCHLRWVAGGGRWPHAPLGHRHDPLGVRHVVGPSVALHLPWRWRSVPTLGLCTGHGPHPPTAPVRANPSRPSPPGNTANTSGSRNHRIPGHNSRTDDSTSCIRRRPTAPQTTPRPNAMRQHRPPPFPRETGVNRLVSQDELPDNLRLQMLPNPHFFPKTTPFSTRGGWSAQKRSRTCTVQVRLDVLGLGLPRPTGQVPPRA